MSELVIHSFDSKILKRKRKVRVFLPESYVHGCGNGCPVIVQQDGQLAFSERDEELPYGSWQLDLRMERLASLREIRSAVIVGVDNSPQRLKEYFPLSEEFERYEQFLLEELLPWVRDEFRVSAATEDTMLLGSSMGGLVSFALAVRNHETFSAAGCLSPWFEYDQNRYLHEVLRELKEKPPVRIYMDSGIRDWRWLDDGHRGMLLARLELLRLGFEEGKDLQWQVDTFFPSDDDFRNTPVKEEKRDIPKWNQHTEFHFGRRSEAALRFLLGE
jgi:predicted alpha/beta superfamily hydrolase